ncbi:MAG: MFS transporter [Pseudomonadaceae bacterium]|nr:MFS transporter [Pseudomonadaceae bacterium]
MAPLYALSAILMIAYAAIFTLLAEIRDTFGFSETAVGVIAGSAFIAGFIAQLTLSRFADSGHGNTLMRAGIALSLIGAVWMCFADSLPAWLASRFLLGFGAGCVRPGIRRLAFVANPNNAGAALGKLAAWEMVGFLIGPALASVLFELAGLTLTFAVVAALIVACTPWVFAVQIPGSDKPLQRAMLTLVKRPDMQACLALGIAFYTAIGVWDAIWAVFIADQGGSQLFIGITMSLFTLPMILIAPWAGGLASRTNVLHLVSATMFVALICMLAYGVIDSIWWMLLPMIVHAVVDAVSMPATQLAVGYASGENAIAAGQGLYGAAGLIVAAVASIGGGSVYQHYGAKELWIGSAAFMLVCLVFAHWRGRAGNWQPHDAVTD